VQDRHGDHRGGQRNAENTNLQQGGGNIDIERIRTIFTTSKR
jgi:hypothetical protein